MGNDIINEIFKSKFLHQIRELLANTKNPLDFIYNMISHLWLDPIF